MPGLPTAAAIGLQYAGACPEFASHGFTGRNGITGLYTRHGAGFGAAVFSWRAVPMFFVNGELHGRRPHHAESAR
jgi:hypothetical protein